MSQLDSHGPDQFENEPSQSVTDEIKDPKPQPEVIPLASLLAKDGNWVAAYPLGHTWLVNGKFTEKVLEKEDIKISGPIEVSSRQNVMIRLETDRLPIVVSVRFSKDADGPWEELVIEEGNCGVNRPTKFCRIVGGREDPEKFVHLVLPSTSGSILMMVTGEWVVPGPPETRELPAVFASYGWRVT